MSDEKKKPEKVSGEQDGALDRIKVLEEALESIEHSRKQKSMISLIGLILVLMGIVLFLVNLKAYAEKKFNDKAFQKEILDTLRDDMMAIAKDNANIKRIQTEFKEDIFPYVAKQVTDRFKKDLPKFQKTGEDFAVELDNYLNNEVKDRVVKAMSESLVEVEGTLKEKYPKMTPDQLQTILDEARNVFIIEITDVIEKKLDFVEKDLATLKVSIDKFKNCEEYKAHDPKNPDTNNSVKIKMVEGMLELILCHIKEQGEIDPLVVEPISIGGAK